MKSNYLKSVPVLFGGLLVIIGLSQCTKKSSIPEKQLIKIYVNILVAQDTISDKSITLDSLRHIVLNNYNVSDNSYKESIQYYNQDPEKWNDFFDKAIEYVEELRANVSD